MKLVFLGTPELAVPSLTRLVDAGHEVLLVVTRPDKRRGRGGATSPSPVKAAAERLGLPVTHDVRQVPGSGAELGVVVAFGRIIPADVLAAVPMVNLHFSLLPRWRGAAPLERAILAGDATTGVAVMEVEPTLDTGGVYAERQVEIGDRSLDELQEELAHEGAELLVAVLSGGRDLLPTPAPQQGQPTYAEKLDPSELELEWARPAVELARVVRLGRAFTSFRGRRLRVLQAVVEAAPEPPAGPGQTDGPAAAPGSLGPGETVVTGEGRLRLLRVQPEGRAAMAAADWRRGVRADVGETLG